MNDYCGTFTIFTDDGSIARVDIVKKVLYYVPFEDLTIDNDILLVEKAIRDYYELEGTDEDEKTK